MVGQKQARNAKPDPIVPSGSCASLGLKRQAWFSKFKRES